MDRRPPGYDWFRIDLPMPPSPPAVNAEAAIAALLHRLVPAWEGRPVAGIEYLPGGYSHRNYRIEMDAGVYALRLVERGNPRSRERCYLAIDSAPEVVAYDPQRGHLLTRWIDGPVLADAPPAVDEAGAYLADLHRSIPAGVRRYDYAAEVTALFDRARRDGRVDPVVAACFERLDWSPAQWRGCHNDLNPWNVIREERPGSTGIGFRTLDWEFAGDNDPLFDLAGLCVGLGWGFEEASACLAAYQEHGAPIHDTAARLRQTLCAFRIREYAWAVAQLAAGNDRDEIRAQAETMRQAASGRN